MGRYLAERYFVRGFESPLEGVRTDTGAVLLEALYLPGDEICLYLFESESSDDVAAAGRFDRVAEVVQLEEVRT
ncbi:MAG TPA: hypothetical protein VFB25_13085 [Gaiellaceae bacterium]|nr:hypothetical protein [Gaiellaceae bacterium]